MPFTLPDLPYADTALAPVISAETLSYHHGKHHAAYVNKLNELIAGTDLQDASLDDIIMQAPKGALFNNAAQHWNHSFYWTSIAPDGGAPAGDLAAAMKDTFGSVDDAVKQLSDTAKAHFGSGWVWLVVDADGKLAVTQTSDADLPMKHGQTALLTIDVWEHAYYIDYRNLRPNYVDGFFGKLANWAFAGKNFAAAH